MDQKSRRDLAREDLRLLMLRPEGRRLLRRILNKCHLYVSPFGTDTHKTAYLAGEMNIGQWLKNEIEETDKSAYHTLMLEASQDLLTG